MTDAGPKALVWHWHSVRPICRIEVAEDAFSKVIRLDPKFEKASEIYFRLGIIYKQQQKLDLSKEVILYTLRPVVA